MPLPPSGPISFSQLQSEFGGSNPISLSEYYEGGSYVQVDVQGTIPTGGTIDISDFYGGQAMNPNLRGLINFDSIPPASGSGYTNSVINITDPYDGQNWSIYSVSQPNSGFYDVVGAFGTGKGIAAMWVDSGTTMAVSRPLSNISSNLFTLDFHIHSDDYGDEESVINIAINSTSTGSSANGAHFTFWWDVGGGLGYSAYFGTSLNRPYISAMPAGWSHIRICYNGSTVFTFVNGTLRDSFSYAGNTLLRSPGGYLVFNATAYWYGSIGSGVGYDNIRLLHGVCLSTSNFTPPTAQWTVTE